MNLNEAARTILEVGNFQYPWKWIDWNWDGNGNWFRAEAESKSGPPLKVLIEGDPETEISVSFKRKTPAGKWRMDKTGQGDEFKIFGTVANIIDAFIERYNKNEASIRPLHKLTFSAEKEKTPSFRGTQYTKTNRASLYSKMAEKLAKKYKAKFTQKEYAIETEYGFVFPESRKLATEAREMLNEIGNTTLPYEWSVWKSSRQHFRATARTTTDDIQLLITFALDLYSGMTDVVFSRNVDSGSFSGQSWSTKKTGEGEQFKIFSTVKNVIEDFVKKYESERGERDMPIGAIRFSADKDQGGGENSRTSLYRTWAKKYARQVGGKFEEKKDRRENSYTIYFSRKNRKLATEAREILDEEIIGKLRGLGIEEAKIVWTPDQIKSMQKASAAEKNDLKKKFSKGKITIKWSQSRAGHAIFVKGRMEGPLFDTEEDAKEYLRDLGIEESFQLNEIGDNPMNITDIDIDPTGGLVAYAEDRKLDIDLKLVANRVDNFDDEVMFEVEFDVNDRMDKTSKGNEIKVFSTVKHIVETWLEDLEEDGIFWSTIEFSASKDGSKKDNTGRERLYARFAKMLAKKYDAKVETKQVKLALTGYTKYIIRKNISESNEIQLNEIGDRPMKITKYEFSVEEDEEGVLYATRPRSKFRY